MKYYYCFLLFFFFFLFGGCEVDDKSDEKIEEKIKLIPSYTINDLPIGYEELKDMKIILSENEGKYWDKRFLLGISKQDSITIKINNKIELLSPVSSETIEKKHYIKYSNDNFFILINYELTGKEYSNKSKDVVANVVVGSLNNEWRYDIDIAFGTVSAVATGNK